MADMGPIALFDKSFLQSLNVDESVWFDYFFYPVISPLFYIETLADLEKAVRAGRTQEQEVGFIANKTPEMHGGPCVHHAQLCLGELHGNRVAMEGRIPVAGGRTVSLDGKVGVVYDQSPEAKAFSRWQAGDFLDVEREFAHQWRQSLNSIDLAAIASSMKALGVDPKSCKNFDDAKAFAVAVVEGKNKPFERMKLALTFLDVPRQYHQSILERWSIAGYPPLHEYVPYTAYVLTVEMFFQAALGGHLISTERLSNRVDIAYLFYLPFCTAFISSDKLHRNCAPYFLRDDQDFVWGEDMKTDLNKINDHFAQLPEQKKEQGIMRFASIPPTGLDGVVSKLWDKHYPSWRDNKREVTLPADPEKNRKLVENLSRWAKAPPLPTHEKLSDEEQLDSLTIQRMIRKRKGNWWQLPSDLKDVPD